MKPVTGAPKEPVTAMRFYYEDYCPSEGLSLSGPCSASVARASPSAFQSEFPITLHFQGPPPDGTDNDAINCFARMMRLFPPFDKWTMGKPKKGQLALLTTTTHDCKTALLALAPGGTIG